MPCYDITFTDRFGRHTFSKWGDSEADAIATLKRSLADKQRGEPIIDGAVLADPQPFSEASRARRQDNAPASQAPGVHAA